MLTENRTGNLFPPSHTLSSVSVNSRHRGLHVTPASAEVAPKFAEGIDAQFLFEVRVLLLLRGQDLPQCADLLLQLDTDTQAEIDPPITITTGAMFRQFDTHFA